MAALGDSALDFDADLHEWTLEKVRAGRSDWPVLTGRIENDRKGRFADGRWIRTSVVVSPVASVCTGQVIQTFNSRYRLHRPRDEPATASSTDRRNN